MDKNKNFVPRKSILVSESPNQFPVCWFHIPEECDSSDVSTIPSYDLDATRVAMDNSLKLCQSVKNVNSEDEEWESKILKYGWSQKHIKLFGQIVKIFDYDKLARLANVDNKRFEAVQRRVAIDKSADRMRKALAGVSWDTQMVQWIHGLLMEYLPPTYLAAYLDIMQTLKTKIPSLVDKMIFWKPGNVNQELLAPILKRSWQPVLANKYRKLPGNTLLVVIPSAAPRLSTPPSRLQKLYPLFTTMAPMLPIQLTINGAAAQLQSLQSISEQTVAITRTKIQELKAENPDRRLILIGMNSASALALQVALVEQVSGVVCFGFSYNTAHGVRGQADDQFLELTTPTLFLVGQNAARSSEEEVEYFCEKISAPTTCVVVGSADDYLRVSKTKRRFEGINQEMVDNMIVDEIADFASKCVLMPNPPKLKTTGLNIVPRREIDSSTGQGRKRKTSGSGDADGKQMSSMKAQKLMRPTSTSDDVLEMAVQSILPDHEEMIPAQKIFTPAPQKISSNRVVQGTTPTGNSVKFTKQSNQKQPGNTSHFITLSGRNNHNPKKFQSTATSRPAVSRPQTPSQYFVTNRPSNVPKKLPVTQVTQQCFSPKKYTIVRTTTNTQNVSYNEAASDISGANILDMPIVFADNEGNIDEEASEDGSIISIASDSPPRVSKPVVLNKASVPTTSSQQFTITKNKNILIQKPVTGKMFLINGTVIGKQLSASNIVLPKPQQTMKMQKFVPSKIVKSTPPAAGKKIEILNNTIIRPAATSISTAKIPTTSFVNLADGRPITSTRLSLPMATAAGKNQIVIKTNSLKPYTGTHIISSTGKTQLGNLTVKRLNVVPSQAMTKIVKKN